jgi:hypothetical protein
LASSDNDAVHSTARTWAAAAFQSQSVPDFGDTVTAQSIGYGYRNTLLIIAQGNNNPSTSAAALAQSYRGGGQTDWFLPAHLENGALCNWQTNSSCRSNPNSPNTGVGASGFVIGEPYYWSSTETTASFARIERMTVGGAQYFESKGSSRLVRPIRAF